MKFMSVLALIASVAVGCGSHPVNCSCLVVRVTGGANNTPLRDAQIWVIDPVNGDRQLVTQTGGERLGLTEEACETTTHEFEVRRPGYVSQRFSHRSSVERVRCDPPPPPEPVLNVHLQQQ